MVVVVKSDQRDMREAGTGRGASIRGDGLLKRGRNNIGQTRRCLICNDGPAGILVRFTHSNNMIIVPSRPRFVPREALAVLGAIVSTTKAVALRSSPSALGGARTQRSPKRQPCTWAVLMLKPGQGLCEEPELQSQPLDSQLFPALPFSVQRPTVP